MSDRQCVEFLRWALPKMHFCWSGFRKVRGQVCKRVNQRRVALGLTSLRAYRDHLQEHAEEWAILDSFCRIPISRFYRDRGVFDTLADAILPELTADVLNSGQQRLSVWSAGCASGEEPYTLQMIWWHQRHRLTSLDHPLELRVLATDVQPHMLQRAEVGRYSASSLKDLPEAWINTFFDQDKDRYRIRAFLREGIEFRLQDLRHQQPDGPFHIILCRNSAFTYFDRHLQQLILKQLLRRLIPGGILITGRHESLPPAEESLRCWLMHCIYRK